MTRSLTVEQTMGGFAVEEDFGDHRAVIASFTHGADAVRFVAAVAGKDPQAAVEAWRENKRVRSDQDRWARA